MNDIRGQDKGAARAPRERALLQARLSFANGAMSYNCRVTQISAGGVRIAIEGHSPLPEHLHITIPQRGIDSPARLVWRTEDSAGLAFHGHERAPEPAPRGLRERIRELEAENAALRAKVTALSGELKQRIDDGY